MNLKHVIKRLLFSLAFVSIVFIAMANWSIDGCYFIGNHPSKSMSMNGVRIWYNGTLRHTRTTNDVQYWEGTNEICVIFPKNYNGPKYEFISTGGMVQIKYQQ